MECQKWQSKEQSYEGTFLGDSFHGYGTYKWQKSCAYEGNFYSNIREGYAVLSMPDNSSFEGLFIKNQPFGPGVLTYSNGRQDVGFWVGQKLVRLSRPVDFIIPRLASTASGKIKLLQFKSFIPLPENSRDSAQEILSKCGHGTDNSKTPYSEFIYDPRSIFFDTPTFDDRRLLNCSVFQNTKSFTEENKFNTLSNTQINLFEQQPCFDNAFLTDSQSRELDLYCVDQLFPEDDFGILHYFAQYGNLDGVKNISFLEENEDFAYDEESRIIEIRGNQEEAEFSPKILSWNRGEICSEIVKQIYIHRASEDKLNFKITELMSGVRTAFRKTGERERQCLYFLKMCSLGPPKVIKELLCGNKLSAELMDSRGNNSLMFAAATDQREIIDILADYGVDVNAFNDENLTPLNLCLLRRVALDYKIFNWEVAFLPPEIDESLYEDHKENFAKNVESIQSLDRKFGDGMSILDSHNFKNTDLGRSVSVKLPFMSISSYIEKNSNSQVINTQSTLNFAPLTEVNANENDPWPNDVSLSPVYIYPTPRTKFFVPKSNKLEEFKKSIKTSSNDKYFFNLNLSEVLPPIMISEKEGVNKNDKLKEVQINEATKTEKNHKEMKMLEEIDKTIAKLLRRGADPNLSEFPKPSIHLGVFSRSVNTVESLLRYGANPNHKLNANEGFLTPLHVLVLLQPHPVCVNICQVLLDFGADTEQETGAEFTVQETEKNFLNKLHGRTPLQLLSMRPDIEYGDLQGYIIDLGMLLVKVSDKKKFYNGHSFLTLAMLTGNIRLLQAFLDSGCLDPNEVLGENLGTALHVLVSSLLQKKIIYENSIKMCDMLLAAGANPLITFEYPSSLVGNCIDYGYRQIEIEKAERKAMGQKITLKVKPKTREIRDHLKVKSKTPEIRDHLKVKSKTPEIRDHLKVKSKTPEIRDHLKDHIRVVEYLREILKKRDVFKEESFNVTVNEEELGKDLNGKESTSRAKKLLSKKSNKKRKAREIDSKYFLKNSNAKSDREKVYQKKKEGESKSNKKTTFQISSPDVNQQTFDKSENNKRVKADKNAKTGTNQNEEINGETASSKTDVNEKTSKNKKADTNEKISTNKKTDENEKKDANEKTSKNKKADANKKISRNKKTDANETKDENEETHANEKTSKKNIADANEKGSGNKTTDVNDKIDKNQKTSRNKSLDEKKRKNKKTGINEEPDANGKMGRNKSADANEKTSRNKKTDDNEKMSRNKSADEKKIKNKKTGTNENPDANKKRDINLEPDINVKTDINKKADANEKISRDKKMDGNEKTSRNKSADEKKIKNEKTGTNENTDANGKTGKNKKAEANEKPDANEKTSRNKKTDANEKTSRDKKTDDNEKTSRNKSADEKKIKNKKMGINEEPDTNGKTGRNKKAEANEKPDTNGKTSRNKKTDTTEKTSRNKTAEENEITNESKRTEENEITNESKRTEENEITSRSKKTEEKKRTNANKKAGTNENPDANRKTYASEKTGANEKADTNEHNEINNKQATESKEIKRVLFSKALLKSLVKIFGGCINIDVNQFLLPYVVFRDGNFYYKFQKSNTLHNEQYSLI